MIWVALLRFFLWSFLGRASRLWTLLSRASTLFWSWVRNSNSASAEASWTDSSTSISVAEWTLYLPLKAESLKLLMGIPSKFVNLGSCSFERLSMITSTFFVSIFFKSIMNNYIINKFLFFLLSNHIRKR